MAVRPSISSAGLLPLCRQTFAFALLQMETGLFPECLAEVYILERPVNERALDMALLMVTLALTVVSYCCWSCGRHLVDVVATVAGFEAVVGLVAV